MTARTATRTAPLAATVAEYRAAGERLSRARVDVDRARDALRAAELAATGAESDRAERARYAALVIRALANRYQDAPVIIAGADYDGPSIEYRAALAHGRVSRSRPDRGSAPRWRAYGWSHRADSAQSTIPESIFEPERGTNDPQKLEAQRAEAEAAMLAWIQPYTGAQWLADQNVAPADPVDVLAVDVYTRHDGGHPGAYVSTVYITAGGSLTDDALQLDKLAGFDLRYGLGNERRPALPAATLAALDALTRGDVPIVDLVADSPAEAQRRIEAARALLADAAPDMLAAWVAGFVTSTAADR